MYGLFRTRERAVKAAERMSADGLATTVTETLPRSDYRAQMFVK
jgi:hypothetical protein